jgi:REP element-mobilizing transposase RayT
MNTPPTSDRLGYKSFYRRNLPHIQPVGADLFLTFRLAGSLPRNVLTQMAEDCRWRGEILANHNLKKPSTESARRHFAFLEKYLDSAAVGPTWLSDSRVADLVSAALHYRDGKIYRLDAFSIMPNHVHCVFRPLNRDEAPYSLSSIMHSLKRNTAKEANQLLKRSGSFWAHENFDHYIRDRAELNKIVRYVLQNPVKARLADDWDNWRWNYVRSGLLPDAS